MRLAQGVDDSHTYLNGAPAYRYRAQNNFKVADGQQLSLAAEHLGQSVNSDTMYTQVKRNVNSVLGGYMGDYGAQQIQLNLRQDDYSDFGAANTGLLGYGLAFADSWRATATVSSAFKAPTFNDMYYPLTFGYQGNPNLKPEHSRNREAGLHYAAYGQHVDAVYFDNRISNLIANNAGFTTVVNINQAQLTGQELSYAGDFGDSHLKANATFQDPRDVATNAVLRRRAREFASVAASQDFAAWNLRVEVRYSGARQDANYYAYPSAPVTLPSYSLLNLTSSYSIDKHFSRNARVDNLFNRNYSEVYSYNMPGRSLFLGLSYR